MPAYDYLIIGGGIAGFTAAETIRGKDDRATIGIISDEPHILYSKVLLPSYLKKKIRREQLFLRTPEQMSAKRIDLFLGMEVTAVNITRQEVSLANGNYLGYEKLLVASGGRVRKWPEEMLGVTYRLHTMDDGDRLFKDLEKIAKPLVVGGSFIGLEFLEIFTANQKKPKLFLEDAHFFAHLLEENGAEIMHRNFNHHGIEVFVREKITDLSPGQAGEAVAVTSHSRQLMTDAVAIGIGIERNIEFLRESKIKMGGRGIQTNEFLETSAEKVWAAGDVAEFRDVLSGQYTLAGNWTSAFLQGQLAGLNMTGEKKVFNSISTYSINNLGLQITAMGDCGKEAETFFRCDRYRNLYERFFVRDGVLTGAVLINRFQDKAILTKLIQSKTDIRPFLDKLGSFDFDLTNIPVIS